MSKIADVRIYGLNESMVAAGYPMRTEVGDIDAEVAEIKHYQKVLEFLSEQEKHIKTNIKNTKESCKHCGGSHKVQKYKDTNDYFCNACRHMLDRYGYIKDIHKNSPNKIKVSEEYAEIISTDVNGNETGKCIIDHEAVEKILGYKWHLSKEGYFSNNKVGNLHRFIALNDEELKDRNIIVDHINKNRLDNRFSNLRITDARGNILNSSISNKNTSGVIGVSYKKDRDKWRAYITDNNSKQKSLGSYKNIEDAIKARLKAESEIYGEYSPQIDLFEKYGIPMPEIKNIKINKKYNLYRAWKNYKRLSNLSQSVNGSGHDTALKGIIVQFNLTFSLKAWLQAERYNWLDFVSSCSTMHCITKMDIRSQCNKYVWKTTIDQLEGAVIHYNSIKDKNSKEARKMFLNIIYNIPSGFELTARMTTNYLQLKTIYAQRRYHKLPCWQMFCDWIEELPHSEWITGKKG